MTDLRAMAREYHAKCDPVPLLRTIPSWETSAFRRRILLSELEELDLAVVSSQRKMVAKEIADVIYVLAGTALHWGIDLDLAMTEVHRSNMSKEAPPFPGMKGIKGPGYSPADMSRACGITVVPAVGGE